jgi:PPK2 family polyphosphate:nucleotide phosphotransferase
MAKSTKSSKSKGGKNDTGGKGVKGTKETPAAVTLSDGDRLGPLLRVPQGEVDLAGFDPRATPGFDGGKVDAPAAIAALSPELGELQERLFAAGRAEPEQARRILLVLQGMDTSGKGGVLRHVIGQLDPQGTSIKAFKAPTDEELQHHFLWRIERELPAPGMIGIFDRSQYEDVLVARVNQLVPEHVWSARYDEINSWEADLVTSGTVVIKCFLHLSKDEQKTRLSERLEDPAKHWKYNPGDLDARARWDDYTTAYQDVLHYCNPDTAPWYVIPADRKWYRNWAITRLLIEHLRDLDLGWPAADFDVEEEQRRLAAS